MSRYPAVALFAALLCLLIGASVASAAVQTENLTIKTGDTPLVRLEQTSENGFSSHTWDLGANESNFFIRDLTDGNKLPFQIRPEAPTASLYVAPNGDIGLGTGDPEAPLQIQRAGAVKVLYTDHTPDPDVSWSTGIPAGGGAFTIGVDGAPVPAMTLRAGGDESLTGSLEEAAGEANVGEVEAVDPATILQQVAALPVKSWAFSSSPGSRHVGPLSEDFAAAFGLGDDPEEIAPADVAGVALAAAQGLIAENRSQANRLEKVEAAANAQSAQVPASTASVEDLSARASQAEALDGRLSKRVSSLSKQLRTLRKAVKKLEKR